jgi:hypothetical protein
MLKSSVISNVWKCDNCPVEVTSSANPFYSLSIGFPSMPAVAQCDIDLCPDCVKTVTTPGAVAYVAAVTTLTTP